MRERLIDFLVDSSDGPTLALGAAIEPAQKILDRILFIAFAQRRDLMRDGLLDRALKARTNSIRSRSGAIFSASFRESTRATTTWIFRPTTAACSPMTRLSIPSSCRTRSQKISPRWELGLSERSSGDGARPYFRAVDHRHRDEARRGAGRSAAEDHARKRTGVVYTPDMVTRFLVEETVGRTLAERRAALHAEHGSARAISRREKEIAFWRAWLETLRGLTIVDPACGSGAFLVAAFDRLARGISAGAGAARRTRRAGADFDAFDEIVTKNLYGVDLNSESVEITRLSLWLKTARRDHRLQNLEATIRVGDSLIEDDAFTSRPFDWRAAFPDVFERGGFDIVIGNPPYVRMELIKAIKPYLDERYVVGAQSADLYAYFYERGVRILRNGGRLGFITSATFFRTSSGEPLRAFLTDGLAIEAIVDFGDAPVFSGVTTYPAIITLFKGPPRTDEIRYLIIERDLPSDLAGAFVAGALPLARARLTNGSWRLEGEPPALLRDKITLGRSKLSEVYAPPLRGILTGLNKAFIIDAATRNQIVAMEPHANSLIRRFLRGENVQRWRVESEDLWLIDIEFGWTRRTFAPMAHKSTRRPRG